MFYREVQGDKMAGRFSALYSVRPAAETHLIFWSYQLHQAMMDGLSLSQSKHGKLFKLLAAILALLPHRPLCASEGAGMEGGSPLAGFGKNERFLFTCPGDAKTAVVTSFEENRVLICSWLI